MPVTVCPHYGVDVDLDAADAGEVVECPACQKAFTAPLPVKRRPAVRRPRRRRRSTPDEHSSPEELIEYAECECGGPADNLFITGAFTILFGLGVAVWGGVLLLGGTTSDRPLPGMSAEQTALFKFVYGLYSVLAGAYLTYAGWQMRRAKQYSICVIACIVALVPVIGPCIFGTLFGYMGIMKLRDPWVKKGFAANRPGFDPDTAT